MALAELQQTTTNRSLRGVSEYEWGLILDASLKREIINHGGELSEEVTATPVEPIAQVLYGQSAHHGIFLQGDFGCGKTTLLKSAVEALNAVIHPFDTDFLAKTTEVCEVSMADLLLHCDECIVKDILNADYLFIDDVGWECNFENYSRVKEVQTIVAAAVRKRYDAMKPTVLATVFDPINFGDIYGAFALEVIDESYLIVELQHRFCKTRKMPRL